MPGMKHKQQLVRLESRLERLIEGAFAQLFGSHVSPSDIAAEVARAMENGAVRMKGTDRPLAPDIFVIILNPQLHRMIITNRPNLNNQLEHYLVDFAAGCGYWLPHRPHIKFLADPDLNQAEVQVHARQSEHQLHSTAAMQPISESKHQSPLRNPHIIINGERMIPIVQTIMNIGRSDDNDIIIDDAAVSRHHLQIRSRNGFHLLFDVDSRGGTRVNGVLIREYQLQPGDVIDIGTTRLIYIADPGDDQNDAGTTTTLDPIET